MPFSLSLPLASYSLGVIGEPGKPWLWEAIQVTVEDIKAVAAHLCGHHQALGAGRSIGPGKRVQRARSGIHSRDGRVCRCQS